MRLTDVGPLTGGPKIAIGLGRLSAISKSAIFALKLNKIKKDVVC